MKKYRSFIRAYEREVARGLPVVAMSSAALAGYYMKKHPNAAGTALSIDLRDGKISKHVAAEASILLEAINECMNKEK